MKRFVIILGVILLVLGVVGLVHPTFNYHQQEEVAKLGPVKATVDEEKTAQVPPPPFRLLYWLQALPWSCSGRA